MQVHDRRVSIEFFKHVVTAFVLDLLGHGPALIGRITKDNCARRACLGTRCRELVRLNLALFECGPISRFYKFGVAIYSSVMGLLTAMMSISTAGGALLLGMTMERTGGSFEPFLVIVGIAVLLGASLLLLLGRVDGKDAAERSVDPASGALAVSP